MPKIIENLDIRIIEEARRQLEQSGYGAVTIRSVAKGCGVGVGTVYNYFSSKEELLAAYMLVDWKECVAVINQTADGTEDVRVVLRCIYDQLQCYARRHQGIFRDEAAASAFAGSFSRYHGLLRSQIANPLVRFCESEFAAEFTAEAMLTWTMAGISFEELYGVIRKVI